MFTSFAEFEHANIPDRMAMGTYAKTKSGKCAALLVHRSDIITTIFSSFIYSYFQNNYNTYYLKMLVFTVIFHNHLTD